MPQTPPSPAPKQPACVGAADWATLLAERRANQRYRFFIGPLVGLASWAFVQNVWPLVWIGLITIATYVDSKVLAHMAARLAQGEAPQTRGTMLWTFCNATGWSLPALLLWPVQPNGDSVATILLCTSLVNAAVTMRSAPNLALAAGLPVPATMAIALLLDWSSGRSTAISLIGSIMALALMSVFGVMILTVLRKVDAQRAQALELTAQARVAAESADRAKADFLDLIRHELQTPAKTLSLAGQQFQRANLPAELRTQMGTFADASEVLSTILDDLLESAKSGGLGISRPRPTDLRVLMRHAVEAWRSSAQERWLELFLDIDADVPERILIDPVRLKQVIYALLSAALDCARQGGVRVRVAVLPLPNQPDDLRVIVAVTDQAIADSAAAAMEQREALLTSTRRLALSLGGEILTKDEPGRGAVTALLFEAPAIRKAPSRSAA